MDRRCEAPVRAAARAGRDSHAERGERHGDGAPTAGFGVPAHAYRTVAELAWEGLRNCPRPGLTTAVGIRARVRMQQLLKGRAARIRKSDDT